MRGIIELAIIICCITVMAIVLCSCQQICPMGVKETYDCVEIAIPIPFDYFIG